MTDRAMKAAKAIVSEPLFTKGLLTYEEVANLIRSHYEGTRAWAVMEAGIRDPQILAIRLSEEDAEAEQGEWYQPTIIIPFLIVKEE